MHNYLHEKNNTKLNIIQQSINQHLIKITKIIDIYIAPCYQRIPKRMFYILDVLKVRVCIEMSL